MSILANDNRTAAQRVADQLRADVKTIYQQMAARYRLLFRLFWHNASATPAEIAEALGTEAAELFRLSNVAVTCLNEAKPGTINNVFPQEFTVNPDGTVTMIPPAEQGGDGEATQS